MFGTWYDSVRQVFVVDCMVDRVCTGRTIEKHGVDVQAKEKSDPHFLPTYL